ncbi:chromosome segregation protein SMC [Polycladidibacter stylochi]|uniref:chromosome segregation protein SMC n=1 Tax=Polycladidibacter stylochi TaxID=1807766 RepID=UPI00082B76FB|nr:chromosome segregation protein SMC [Pseudovibrio stylochi]
MKFQRLRVVGFKSFVEPMEFVMDDGLTGVVGPNGCGKSNLVEALRWVMGENSYKNMRASGMDDVIFSGSLNRPARNSAEVTVFLDNEERDAPTGYNDSDQIEISRRIEREAGSAYKINGKDVRARDVQLLFADASTGARSPSMVRQGQIGELIAAKPTARRKILEEAAGISGLHSRRNEAEIRLRAAESNLERLEDVLVQLDGQLEGLKRQARQATRYRNLSSDIRQTEATLLYLRWSETNSSLDEARKLFAEAEAALNNVSGLQAVTAKEQAIMAHELPKLRDEAASAGAALQHLVIARNELDAEDRRVRERLADIARRLQQLQDDMEREQTLLEENSDYLEALEQEQAELEAQQASMGEQEQAASQSLLDASQQVELAEAKQNDLNRQNAQMVAKRQQLMQQVGQQRERITRYNDQEKALSGTLAAIVDEIERAHGPSAKREELEMAQEELAYLEEEVLTHETAVAEARQTQEEAREPVQVAKAALSQAQTEADTLRKILSHSSNGAYRPILDDMSVEAGLETALGAVLGDDLEASPDVEAPVSWPAHQVIFPAGKDAPLPAKATALSQFVKAPPQMARRLAQIGLVESDQGAVLATSLAAGQRLVAKDGQMWRWDGLHIKADAPTAAAQRLAQRNRLAELEASYEALETTLEVASEHHEAAVTACQTAQENEQAARQKLRLHQGRIVQLQEELAATERALTALSVKKNTLEEQVRRAGEDRTEAEEHLEELHMALEELPPTEELEATLAQTAQELALARANASAARLQVDNLQNEAHMRQRRQQAIKTERQSWLQRTQNAGKQVKTIEVRIQEAQEEREMLLEAPEEIELKRHSLLSAVAEAEEKKRLAETALSEGERRQHEADRKAKEALEGLSGARERKIRAEERLTAARQRRVETEERITETLEVGVGQLFQLAGLKEGAPLPDVTGIEKRLERYKNERERLGGVNLRAETEMAEVNLQLETLTGERDDLIEAIKKLRVGIANLNKEARERLLNSFNSVDAHFQRLFTHLFGGGTAELKLVDSEDPLDAGLEIFARPPGKKPQTMTLLSGGEQALTAMALIFAVFLTNPAPICVLDEVDAPLDDANVERYCALLEEMAANTHTRFTVITHNPITMARMNRLFGVTMAERGVSQLVSVDLQTAEQFLETS